MKAQTSAYLDSAEEALRNAKQILAINIPRQAARLAYYAQFYYAQFYAAQALIFEGTNKVAKTHKGVDKEFHRLAAAEPSFSPGLAATLSATYHFKNAADYETGPAGAVTIADAGQAIAAAEHFVTSVRRAIMPAGPAAP